MNFEVDILIALNVIIWWEFRLFSEKNSFNEN